MKTKIIGAIVGAVVVVGLFIWWNVKSTKKNLAKKRAAKAEKAEEQEKK
jgi:hypothetical protein